MIEMTSRTLTNVLLLLIFLALMANLLAPAFKAREAMAVMPGNDSVPPAVVAAQVSEEIAPDRLAQVVAAALRDIADADKEIAAAILEHSRSNANVAYSLDRIGAELRAQRSE